MPDYMFAHAAAGYGGQGTLCGALGASTSIITMVQYDKDKTYAAMVDDLLDWYAQATFPTHRFDDLSPLPKQIQTKAMTPLCHTSVSKWTRGSRRSGDVQREERTVRQGNGGGRLHHGRTT